MTHDADEMCKINNAILKNPPKSDTSRIPAKAMLQYSVYIHARL